ncbi:hypothetical protein GCM10010193_20290 [Kitasatospora atroaurantiaca]|uniref:Acyl carrier protein n=1 Tax=Kitasatospora atroaurantiaca TaxID=285545 RepID=A0A561EVE9_9ACTN|nr:acyl carrier protein [Kitasatospora atroaurantiaca]TWE19576.1 acyl carrier protein [Kitasatospora atroaurantiaca]
MATLVTSSEPVLLSEVAQVAAEILGTDAERPTGETRFHDDLGFDSVMLMQLKYRLESRLPELGELSLPDMVDSMRSVRTLAEYLGSLLLLESY